MIDTKRLVLHTLKQIYDSILAIQDLNRGQIDWNRFFSSTMILIAEDDIWYVEIH